MPIKHRKRIAIVVILAGLVLMFIVGLLTYKNKLASRAQAPRYATGYEDAAGWVYSCTRPVQVADQGATYGNGEPSLTPVNQAEANKYCQRGGIE